jgi:hypothetical protein
MHALINLTLPTVMQEIEDVLEEYPENPYHLAFSIHELRQKLIAYVLSHVPNRYAVEGVEESTKHLNVRHASHLAERLKMEMIVRAGILNILRENADYLSRKLPQL